MIFKNRDEAGKLLAQHLKKVLNIQNPSDWVVIAIPR
jgi:predicted phosphoribosyltransferase